MVGMTRMRMRLQVLDLGLGLRGLERRRGRRAVRGPLVLVSAVGCLNVENAVSYLRIFSEYGKCLSMIWKFSTAAVELGLEFEWRWI